MLGEANRAVGRAAGAPRARARAGRGRAPGTNRFARRGKSGVSSGVSHGDIPHGPAAARAGMGSRAWARLGLFGESQKAAGGLQAVAGGRAPGQASCVRSTWCGCTRGGRLVAMAGAGLSSESSGGCGLFGESGRAAGGLQAVAGGGAPWQVPRACSASCGCVRCGRLAAVAGARSGSRSCNGHGLCGEAQRAAAELLQANEGRVAWWQDASMCPGAVVHGGGCAGRVGVCGLGRPARRAEAGERIASVGIIFESVW